MICGRVWIYSSPLTRQLQRDVFQWDDEAEITFICLKQALVSVPVLALPEFSIPFIVELDASGFGVGAVLIQGKGSIAYFS